MAYICFIYGLYMAYMPLKWGKIPIKLKAKEESVKVLLLRSSTADLKREFGAILEGYTRRSVNMKS